MELWRSGIIDAVVIHHWNTSLWNPFFLALSWGLNIEPAITVNKVFVFFWIKILQIFITVFLLWWIVLWLKTIPVLRKVFRVLRQVYFRFWHSPKRTPKLAWSVEDLRFESFPLTSRPNGSLFIAGMSRIWELSKRGGCL